jgi:hypothetical protein
MADNDFKGAGAGVIGATIAGFNCACGTPCKAELLTDGRTEYSCPVCEHVVATVGKANE